MIFSRRRIQAALWAISCLTSKQADRLVDRLNRGEMDSLAAMWEVLLLRALMDLGEIRHEVRTQNGKYPDILFENEKVMFTADVSCVSDEGLKKENPFDELLDEIERQKQKLGLGIGGVYLQAGHHEGERKVKLKLPPLDEIAGFVGEQIIPAIDSKLKAGEWPVRLQWDTQEIQFTLTVKDGPYSGGGSRSYDSPKTVKSNPIYSRLREKSDQVAYGTGLRGLVLCDSGYSAFTPHPMDRSHIDAEKISAAFLDGTNDVDFVVLIWIEQKSDWAHRHSRKIRHLLLQKTHCAALSDVWQSCIGSLPAPKRTGLNARHHLRFKGRNLGFGGGHTMAWPSIKISSIMLLNLLSGRITIDEFNERNEWRSADAKAGGRWLNVFERALQEGRLPKNVVIESSIEDDDDRVAFEFGPPDPALAPFRASDRA